MHNIKLVGFPFDYGQTHPGVRNAPEALRSYGLIEELEKFAPVIDLGDVDLDFPWSSEAPTLIKQEKSAGMANLKISQFLEQEDLSQSFLLNVGGDHGMALGTIHGILSHRPETVVVWADAHGDLNTPESSPSGNFHGMPLAFLLKAARAEESFHWLKQTLAPQKIIFFGPRDLDPGEMALINDLSIQYFSSREINLWGATPLLERALKKADPHAVCPIHLSFDVDIFDPQDVHSTGTRVQEGPGLSEIFKMAKCLGETGRVRSMDVVEVNPEIGSGAQVDLTLKLVQTLLEFTLSYSMNKRVLAS